MAGFGCPEACPLWPSRRARKPSTSRRQRYGQEWDSALHSPYYQRFMMHSGHLLRGPDEAAPMKTSSVTGVREVSGRRPVGWRVQFRVQSPRTGDLDGRGAVPEEGYGPRGSGLRTHAAVGPLIRRTKGADSGPSHPIRCDDRKLRPQRQVCSSGARVNRRHHAPGLYRPKGLRGGRPPSLWRDGSLRSPRPSRRCTSRCRPLG